MDFPRHEWQTNRNINAKLDIMAAALSLHLLSPEVHLCFWTDQLYHQSARNRKHTTSLPRRPSSLIELQLDLVTPASPKIAELTTHVLAFFFDKCLDSNAQQGKGKRITRTQCAWGPKRSETFGFAQLRAKGVGNAALRATWGPEMIKISKINYCHKLS